MFYSIVDPTGAPQNGLDLATVTGLIQEGRLNAASLIWRSDTDNWQAVGNFPEFHTVLSNSAGSPLFSDQPFSKDAATNPYASPASMHFAEPAYARPASQPLMQPAEVQNLQAMGIQRIRSVSATDCFSRAFATMFSDAFWPILGVSLVYFLLTVVSSMCYASIVVAAPFAAGYSYYLLRHVRGQPAVCKDLFHAFSVAFGHSLGAYYVCALFVAFGFVFLILPGIFLSVAFTPVLFLVVDKRMHFWDAMMVSLKVVMANWWMVFLLCLLGVLLSFGGLLCLIIGLVVAVPIYQLAVAHCYEQIFGNEQDEPSRAMQPWEQP